MELNLHIRPDGSTKYNHEPDFKFVVLEKFLSYDNDLPAYEKIILTLYFFMKRFSLSEAKAFGLDSSSVKTEKFPLVISQHKEINLKRQL